MPMGRAMTGGGVRMALRSAIILAAIAVLVLALAPMAWTSDSTLPDRQAGQGDGCFTTHRPDVATRGMRARNAGAGERLPVSGPCGGKASFDRYGLGSLIWRGPDWGDPAQGERT